MPVTREGIDHMLDEQKKKKNQKKNLNCNQVPHGIISFSSCIYGGAYLD